MRKLITSGLLLCGALALQAQTFVKPTMKVKETSFAVITDKGTYQACEAEFKAYQEQVYKNSQAFCKALVEEGFNVISGGTDNHLILLDLRPFGITGKDFEIHLDEVHITANKNSIPNDPEKPTVTSGLRVGTPAVTSRGFVEADMVKIAKLMGMVARDFEGTKEQVIAEVDALCNAHPIYE